MAKLIIVCGLTASGKTTLAKELSRELNIFCLHKDSLKSNLYDILELSTLADSKKLGLQSVHLLFRLAEEQLKNGIDLIIESPFNHEGDYELFRRWEKEYNLDVWKIICKMDDDERDRRYRKRLNERHRCHHDEERIASGEFDEISKAGYVIYENMPGKKIEVVTNKPVKDLVNQVVRKINQ
jgi:predicted kinase